MRHEDELRRALREEVSGVGSSEEAWRSIERRLDQQTPGRRGSRVAAIALALTLSTASLVGLWVGFRSGGIGREVTPGEPPDLQPRVTAVVPVGSFPRDIAIGEGAVWVSVPAQGPDEDDLIVRVDPVTNEVAARIPMEDYIDELAAGEGGIWGVGVEGSGADLTLYVVRIDPATNEVVATIRDVSGPLAVGEGALWAVDRAGARAGPEGSSLLRIDPATNEVEATIPLGVAAWDIEIGEGYVWILPLEPGPGEGNVLQVDPATNEIVARIEIPIPGTVFAPAVGEGSAWVPVCCVDNELTLVRVDVGTSRIMGEPITVEAGAPFAVAAGHVWLVDEGGALYGLNVATSEVDETVSGFEWPAGGFPDPSAELDPAQLTVWIANYQDSVTRIDLAAGSPSPSFPLTYPEGDNEVMPIAFLNGTTAEIVYPADLPIEQVTIQPAGSLYDGVHDFSLDGLTSRFVVWREPVKDVEPIESYDPPLDGIVRKWQAVRADGQTFRLGPWLVEVPYETLTDEQRQAFLDHLLGLETEGGFLILEATRPLLLWPTEEGELVTQIYFDIDNLQILDRCIDFSQAADDSFLRNGIRVFRVTEGADVGVDVYLWCDRTGEFGIQVDEGPLADALIDGLSFRKVNR